MYVGWAVDLRKDGDDQGSWWKANWENLEKYHVYHGNYLVRRLREMHDAGKKDSCPDYGRIDNDETYLNCCLPVRITSLQCILRAEP